MVDRRCSTAASMIADGNQNVSLVDQSLFGFLQRLGEECAVTCRQIPLLATEKQVVERPDRDERQVGRKHQTIDRGILLFRVQYCRSEAARVGRGGLVP